MYQPTKYSVDFSINNDGQIEYVSVQPDEDSYTRIEISDLLQRLIDENKLHIGERCEGEIKVDEDIINVKYHWCTQLGEDWDDDEWEDEELTIPNQ